MKILDALVGVGSDQGTDQGTDQGVGPASARQFYRRLASGVAVVTAVGRSGPAAMTASTVVAVSLSPPLLLVSLAHGSRTLAAIEQSGQFGVHLLCADQVEVADRFSGRRPGPDRYPPDLRGGDVLDGVLATATCTLTWTRAAGDHTLVLGTLVGTSTPEHPGRGPLVWTGSGYHQAVPAAMR